MKMFLLIIGLHGTELKEFWHTLRTSCKVYIGLLTRDFGFVSQTQLESDAPENGPELIPILVGKEGGCITTRVSEGGGPKGRGNPSFWSPLIRKLP